MWQTDTEQSEALEQVGAERPDVLVVKITDIYYGFEDNSIHLRSIWLME